MDDKELEELIQKETKELAEKQFLNGVLVGWNSCLFSIKREISDMTSSRKIKKFIDNKINESKNRIDNTINKEEIIEEKEKEITND